MTATAMKSTLEGASAAYINYTVTVGGKSITTKIMIPITMQLQ